MSESIPTRIQQVMGDATTRLIVPAASFAGLVFFAIAVLTGDVKTIPLAVTGLVVAAIAWNQQRNYSFDPMPIFWATSVGFIAVVPFSEPFEAIVLLPPLVLMGFVGFFSASSRNALILTVWSALLVGWAVWWHVPDLGVGEAIIAVTLFVATSVAVWAAVRAARRALAREQESYRLLFESSPVAMFEEDYTAVAEWLNEIRRRGVQDIRSYLIKNPGETRHGISLIRVLQANPAAVRLVGAKSVQELTEGFQEVPRANEELGTFIEQFVAIWQGRRSLAVNLQGLTFVGEPLEAVMHWSVPVVHGVADLGQVMIAISDITPRKVIEDRLANAVQTNQRFLAQEHALAACSRALLLRVGDDAIEVALEALRAASGADRAFLAGNVIDPDEGLCFRVVNSASKVEYSQDDWVGRVIPWSKYPTAHEQLSKGEAFHHEATDDSTKGWRRSLLAVPVFTNGEWTGSIGFMDIGRKTEWTNDAVKMLEVAAPMLGNFWERELTTRRLEELVMSKDRFVASISHELRTPLSAVLGFAEELKNHASTFEPHESTEILELIAEQSRDMADMVEDLLVAARADIGTVTIHPEEVYLRAQAEAAVVALGSAGTKTISVVGGPGKAWADPQRTKQVIRNLLTNAVRYGGSNIAVEARSEGELTRFSVRDDGEGLAKHEWERIFEPYTRAHERPTQAGSVGLGLTVSRQLARLMGGDLSYRADDAGSVFELTLPAGPPEEIPSPVAESPVEATV